MRREIYAKRDYYTKILENPSSQEELTPEQQREHGRAKMFLLRWSNDKAVEEAVKKFFAFCKKVVTRPAEEAVEKIIVPRKKVVNRPACVHIESTPVDQEVSSLPHGILSALKRPNAGKQKKTLTFGVLHVCEFEKNSSTNDFGVIVTVEI